MHTFKENLSHYASKKLEQEDSSIPTANILSENIHFQ